MIRKILLLSCLALFALVEHTVAQTVVVDGIEYTLDANERTATVTRYWGVSASVVVPAQFNYGGWNYAVTVIGNRAFDECTSLQDITLSDGISIIEDYAFDGCKSLINVILPTTLQSIGHMAFFGCSSLLTIELPKGITNIESFAFSNCSSLSSINIPNGVTSIGRSAFGYCSISSIDLPSTLKNIGESAFRGCPLTDIVCRATNPPTIDYTTFDVETYTSAVLYVHVELEDVYRNTAGWSNFKISVFDVEGDFCYMLDDKSQYIVITKYIGESTKCTIPAVLSYKDENYPVRMIGDNAFSNNKLLEDVNISDGIESIGYWAFRGCSALVNISFPESIETFGQYTFSECTSLKSVVLPKRLKEVGYTAFYKCTSLTDVVLPEEATSISWLAFGDCTSLKRIVLPASLQRIVSHAFYGCPLTDITCLAVNPPSIVFMGSNDAFDQNTYETACLHVPEGTVADYQTAESWKNFLNIVDDQPNGISALDASDSSIAAYADGVITTATPATINVYAQSGARVMHAADATMLSLESLPRGIYIVNVKAGTERQVMKVAR